MEFVLGVDEAGRGPLAGPVSVGVVRAPKDFDFLAVFPGLNDSKALSEAKREALFALLEEQVAAGALTYTVVFGSVADIDAQGIVPTVHQTVFAGIRALAPEAHGVHVFLDGLLHAPEEYSQETVVRGDATIPAIMLASVAAKVLRDRHMECLSVTYPGYGFEKHKGYGTKAHAAAIKTLGLSKEHRHLFCRNFA